MLYECNPFIAIYKTAFERLQDPGNSPDIRIILNLQMRLLLEEGADRRRNNLPTADEVAIIISDEYDRASFRDIVLACRQSENDAPIFQNISSTTAAYMPLHYVLLFPCGDLGWHWALRLHDPNNLRKNSRITQRTFYRYMLHTRHNIDAFLFRGGRLFQQYLVDAWAACDQNKCDWTRTHQANLRADLYNGLVDSMTREDRNAANLGEKIILPSSFVGGDRWMMQLYQNSMAIVRHFGRPSLFVTFTANPKTLSRSESNG